MGMVSTTIFKVMSGPPDGFPLVMRWNNRARHIGILTKLEDIRLALYQQSKKEQRRYDYLPTCEPFLTPELVTSADYIDWLRHNDKLYLLSNVERSRQCCLRRSRRASNNPRSGEHVI
ncbi:hypothetical protein Golob_023207, partial [Gossypium lobatum]|nr:hypothetical protein [Gossypium lobatum]